MNEALITNDIVVFGILMSILALVFHTAASPKPFWKKFYTYVPSILLCYFLPSILNTLGIISGQSSGLYTMAKNYMLPAALVMLTLSIDLKGIAKLGSKAVIMFFVGTIGIIIGGPLAILITSTFAPDIVGGVGPEAVWRGMATIAGSWIGGGANQAAMLEVFGASKELFSIMITVDVIVANIWMAVILYGAGRSAEVDKLFKADASAIEEVKDRIEKYRLGLLKIPTFADSMRLAGLVFFVVAVSHFLADWIGPAILKNAPNLEQFSLTSTFFWMVVIATTIGLAMSFTKVREMEGIGASRIGSVFLYILVATIGMQMDVMAVFSNPGFFMVGGIWMLIHIALLLTVAKIIKAPFFFVALGSQANVGGAASAPIVASAFHPALAPVGVLLAVLGYAVGTYGAWICGILMQTVAQ